MRIQQSSSGTTITTVSCSSSCNTSSSTDNSIITSIMKQERSMGVVVDTASSYDVVAPTGSSSNDESIVVAVPRLIQLPQEQTQPQPQQKQERRQDNCNRVSSSSLKPAGSNLERSSNNNNKMMIKKDTTTTVSSSSSSSSLLHTTKVVDTEERVCTFCKVRGKMIDDWKNGDRVCTNCGLIDDEHLFDTNPEWRDYDNDDRASGGIQQQHSTNARCGLVITDETKYWGGLQPTTLSKYIFGGVSTNRPSSYSTGTALRKSVSMANYRVQHRIEQIQKRQLDDAKLSYQIRKKHKERNNNGRSRKRRRRRRIGDEQEDDDDDDDDDVGSRRCLLNDNHSTVQYQNGDDVDDDDSTDAASCYNDEEDTTSRPELERLILQEEEDAYKLQIAINSDKWSLDRAIRLFGGTDGHAQPILSFNEIPDGTNDDDNEDSIHNDTLIDRYGNVRTKKTGKTKKLDKSLRKASFEMYTVYNMLLSAATTLQLPSTVTDEAVALLCRYVQLRDGVSVRGVVSFRGRSTTSSTPDRLSPTGNNDNNNVTTTTNNNYNNNKSQHLRLKSKINSNQPTNRVLHIQQNQNQQRERGLKRKSSSSLLLSSSNCSNQEETSNEQIQLQKELQKEYDLLKQMGALCSALLYLTSRAMKCPRTIDEVCNSIQDPAKTYNKYSVLEQFNRTGEGNESTNNNNFIQRMHCSRAMTEVKESFPDFARTVVATSGSQTTIVVVTDQERTTNNEEEPSSLSNNTTSMLCQEKITTTITATVDNYDSVCNFVEHTLRKLVLPPVAQASIRCLVYLCRNRSKQHSQYMFHTEQFASAKLPTVCASMTYFISVVGTTMRTLALQAAKNAIEEKQRKASTISNSIWSSSTSSSNTSFDWKNKYSAVQATSKHIAKTTRVPTTTTTTKSKPSSSAQAFDVFAADVDATTIQAEHRAYEMRRMWDAWIEQMEWKRSLVDIEKVTNVSQKIIRDYCKQYIFPIRQQLLQILCDSVVVVLPNAITTPIRQSVDPSNGSNSSTEVDTLYPEQIELKETPLATLLLTHITVATSLMKI